MCGEKKIIRKEFSGVEGSPPHVRGKANKNVNFANREGITPACAGKSTFLLTCDRMLLGSPPRVRGKEH